MTSQLKALLSAIRQHPGRALLIGVMAALCIWTYWPAFAEMAEKWQTDPQYSHGYLVPAFALVLLYLRRERLKEVSFACNWRGLVLLVLGAAGYVLGAYLYIDWVAAMSLLPTAAGLVVLLGGWPGLRWAWPAIGFLVFMFPLPFQAEMAFAQPLRRMATLGSTWLLQLVGIPALAEGNVILLNSGKIEVVDACNGLSMLLTFGALATGMAILIRRPLIDRLVIVASAVPIAVVVNILRITLHGIAFEVWGPEVADRFFHDQAGWLMMPMALLLLWLEIWFLNHLLVAPPARTALYGQPKAAGGSNTQAERGAPARAKVRSR